MSVSHVLLADNDRDFLDTRAEYLETPDYLVLKAYSLEQARQLMQETRVHLAILDIRLLDDDDEKDTSGLTLAKEPAFRSIPKIILTGFPTYEYVREVLGPVLNGLPAAVQFLAKQEGPEVMLKAVEETLTRYARINWDMAIHWSTPLSFLHLVNFIEPDLAHRYLIDRMGELEDLFRRLFYDNKQITLSQLLTQSGGKVSLMVFAFSEVNRSSQFIVVCGLRESIQAEQDRYERLVPKTTGEGSTVRAMMAETVHFIGVAYKLVGADLEETISLSEYYQSNTVARVKDAFDYLFRVALKPLYHEGRYREKVETVYDFFQNGLGINEFLSSEENLERVIRSICQQALTAGLMEIKYSLHSLSFPHPDGNLLPNPAAYFSKHDMATTLLLYGTTYGQLNGNTVLVDRRGRTWLFDFSQVDQGPLVRDFVSLETAIKFDLFTSFDPYTRYEVEQRLISVSRLDMEIDADGLEAEAQKALLAINHIRQYAVTVMGQELGVYFTGLLFYAMAQLATFNPKVRYPRNELAVYLHSLISAAMLCKNLMPAARENLPLEAFHSLWIDETNKEVWVEGRKVELAPGEYELLILLYYQANQLCTRQDISQKLHHTDYGPVTEDAINTTVTRLRKKIEPDSRRPKYVVTVRGEGYRLEIDHNPLLD